MRNGESMVVRHIQVGEGLILPALENPACDIELVSGEVEDVIVGRVVWAWQKLD